MYMRDFENIDNLFADFIDDICEQKRRFTTAFVPELAIADSTVGPLEESNDLDNDRGVGEDQYEDLNPVTAPTGAFVSMEGQIHS
jgi:hypothetical protein